ncbi:hypothetical protein GOP47_0027884, partial [Adiantum capillus-veneris]
HKCSELHSSSTTFRLFTPRKTYSGEPQELLRGERVPRSAGSMELRRCLLLILVLCVGSLLQVGLSSASFPEESGDGGQIFSSWQGLHGDEAKAGTLVEEEEDQASRLQRLLLAITPHISYGALRADNTRCPPMSGRSYYLPNCRTATGPVNPYERGCLAITRCGRDTS